MQNIKSISRLLVESEKHNTNLRKDQKSKKMLENQVLYRNRRFHPADWQCCIVHDTQRDNDKWARYGLPITVNNDPYSECRVNPSKTNRNESGRIKKFRNWNMFKQKITSIYFGLNWFSSSRSTLRKYLRRIAFDNGSSLRSNSDIIGKRRGSWSMKLSS